MWRVRLKQQNNNKRHYYVFEITIRKCDQHQFNALKILFGKAMKSHGKKRVLIIRLRENMYSIRERISRLFFDVLLYVEEFFAS